MKTTLIIVLNFLRLFTTKSFDFVASLFIFMIYPIITMSVGFAIYMLICHFIYFKYMNNFMRKTFKTDESYNDYTDKINVLKGKLKNQ
jgi:hypothetical protein